MLKTGIPKLDELLGGGLEENKSILFCSDPGVEDLQFAQQFLFTRLNQGDHAIYFVNNKKPETVRFMFKNYDWDLAKFEKKRVFTFFDVYSGLMGLDSEERFSVKNPTKMEDIKKDLLRAVKTMKNNNIVIIFDSLSSMVDLFPDSQSIISCIKGCIEEIHNENIKTTPVFLFTKWPYDEGIIREIRTIFDCVIDLKAIEQKVILRNYFSVSKANWLKKVQKQGIPFKILKPGGIKVYIPKILVTGPFNAGKTSFIYSASTKAVSVDRLGTTVALDHGHVDHNGFSVDLWGTPGQERFDPIMELLGGESLGVIVVIDSTDPRGFARAKDMLEITKTEGLPSVIVANKADLNRALKPDEIRNKMKLPKNIPIIPITAEDLSKVKENQPCQLKKEDIDKVFDKLFGVIV